MNSICQQLIDDNFCDNENEWQKNKNCAPPYIIVIFGPTNEYNANGLNYIKRLDDEIQTYDSFREAKVELRRKEDIVLPRLLPALFGSFSLRDQPVRFLLVERTVAGKTSEGKTIHDMQITVSATLSTSRLVEDGEIKDRLSDAIGRAGKLNAKVARFHHLALYEDDLLKKFLYFFLAIEINTHATFSNIDHPQMFLSIFAPPSRVTASAKQLFDKQRESWRAVRDRFVWCVVCAWPDLSDSDVEDFIKLKNIRDNIAHGNISVPPGWAVTSAEKLATKLQQRPVDAV